MRKKIFIHIVAVLIFGLSLFASDRKTYLTSSSEYKMAYALCVSAGVLPPSSVSPISASEILTALDRIPPHTLSNGEQDALAALKASLDWKPLFSTKYFGADINPIISPEIYYQTNIVPSLESHKSYVPNEYLIKVRDRLPGINLHLTADFASVGYGYVDNEFISAARKVQSDKHFGTNFDGTLAMDMEHDATMKVGLSVGNAWMDFTIARDKQSLGYGHMGNLGIGDNFIRQDFMRLHFYSQYFDYTYNLTQYDTMSDTANETDMAGLNKTKLSGYQQLLPVHRFEVKIADKVQLVLQEQTMLYIDNFLDLRLLNPFIFLHGLNNYKDEIVWDKDGNDEANNLVVLELGYTVIPHLRLDLQVGLDQITLPGEVRGDDNTRPPAYGLMFTIDSPWIVNGRYLNGWCEIAYTTPNFYLNKKKNGDKFLNNLDYIVGYKSWRINDIGYTGFRYGPDAFAIGLGLDWGEVGLFDVSGSLTYVMHGLYGYGYRQAISNMGPSSIHDYAISLPFDQAEHRIEAFAKASYEPIKGLKFKMSLGYIHIWNLRTQKGEPFSDLQTSFGISFDPVEMFK